MMLPQLSCDTQNDILVHQMRWVRQSNCVDNLFLCVPKNSVPDSATNLNLTWQGEDIPWIYIGTAREPFSDTNGGQWLFGSIISPDRKAQLEQSEDKFVIYQVPQEKDGGWKQLLQETTAASNWEDEIGKKIAPVVAALPHPTAFIKPPNWTTRRFLTQLISTIHYSVPKIIGWHLRDISFLFALDIGEKELQDNWQDFGIVQNEDDDILRCFFKRTTLLEEDISTFWQCIQMERVIENTGDLFPTANIYEYNGQKLFFHRFEAIYPSSSGELTIKLELRTQPAMPTPVLPLLTTGGIFQNWNEDGMLWKIKLTGGNIKDNTELFAYPHLQFNGSRGVYVPPEEGDEVLVTIPHGGFPTVNVLTRHSQDNDGQTVTLLGNSIALKSTDGVMIKGKTSIKGKLEVGG